MIWASSISASAPPAYARNRERFAKQGLVVGQAAQPLFAWSTLPVEKAKREEAAQRRPARSEWKKRLFSLANVLWTATGRWRHKVDDHDLRGRA